MKKQTKKINKKQLRQEYYQARQDGQNLLQWCTRKAVEYGMTYGEFVTKVGI